MLTPNPTELSPTAPRRLMDRSLARGHLNRFLDGLTGHEIFSRWPAGTRLPCIALMFRECARAASPEQPLKRLKPLLAPVFPVPKVCPGTPRQAASS